jgi:hypothetical protein
MGKARKDIAGCEQEPKQIEKEKQKTRFGQSSQTAAPKLS